jgi:hypothetical protein
LSLLVATTVVAFARSGQVAPKAALDDGVTLDFGRDIRPILGGNCFVCHGPDRQRSDLRFDERDAALSGGRSGTPLLVPGDAAASEIVRRLTSTDEDERMPPADEGHDPLPPEDIERIAAWINAGAEWPAGTGHWAFEPIVRPDPPTVVAAGPVRPIDAFVLARLEAAGLEPAPEAEPATAVRRLHIDLLGLPPEPALVDAYLANRDPDAWERLVEQLLASPHFGERWARHWLDKARYADTDGYEQDQTRPEAWRFRDWVIDAINDDMPFDRFTVHQLAGDLLTAPTDESRLATGFHRQTLTNREGGVDEEEFRVEAVLDRVDTTSAVWMGLTAGCARCHDHKFDPLPTRDYYSLSGFFNNTDETTLSLPVEEAVMAEFRAADERHVRELDVLRTELLSRLEGHTAAAMTCEPLEVTSARTASGAEISVGDDGVLTATAGAADHHVEATTSLPELSGFALEVFGPRTPIELLAFTVGSDGRPVPLLEVDRSAGWDQDGEYRHVTWKIDGDELLGNGVLSFELATNGGALERFRITGVTGSESGSPLTDTVRRIMGKPKEQRDPQEQVALRDHHIGSQADTRALRDDILRLMREAPQDPTPQAAVLAERIGDRRADHVLVRGDFLRRGDAVSPGTPAVLPALAPRGATADRLDLARWLVAPEHPLTARVFANDVWLHLFGQGLVRTPGDFGARGEPPSHPELLDWLASEALRLDWSRKALIREIVTSRTYRQSSRHRGEPGLVDPQNLLLHRQNRFRVEAEIVRDLSLAVADLLDPRVGGPSVFPPLPPGVANQSYAFNFKWSASEGADRYRRGLYTFIKRTAPHPNLTAFDAPDSITSCVLRSRSNTPLQALTTLNNEVFVEAAQGLAARVVLADDDDDGRLRQAFRVCVARDPDADERRTLRGLLDTARDWYAANPKDAELISGGHEPDGVELGEFAAWVATLRIVLNLDEFLNRA